MTGKNRARIRKKGAAAPANFHLRELPTLEFAGRVDRIAKLVARAVGDVARDHGATASQLHIVERLARSPEGLTAKQLAAALAIRPGSLTGMLDSLEKRGVLQRQSVKGDARQQKIVLLEGAEDFVALLPKVEAAIAASLGTLAKEDVGRLSEDLAGAEAAIRVKRAAPAPRLVPTPAPEVVEASVQSASAPGPVTAPTVAAPAAAAQAPAPAAVDRTLPVPEVAAAPAPKPDEPPQWQRADRREQSEGSLGRGLFRIASRVISAAEGRRRNK